MNVLLVGPDFEENLSIRYLSAALQAAGHRATLAAFNGPAQIPEIASAAANADLVGLSMCFQSRAGEFLELARLIKSAHPTKRIVAGGHYASCAAGPLLAHHPEIDLVVIHEGERTLVEIADAGAELAGRLPHIPGLAYRDGAGVHWTAPRPTLDDLDTLPFPDRTGPARLIAGVPTAYLMGSRGCFGKCAYCCITTLHRLAPGKRFRQRRPERIADEMAVLYHERGVRQFIFHDDNFLVPWATANHERLAALEAALARRAVCDIALVIKCRPADADKEVLRRLRDMGLLRVFLGIESATASGLAVLERNQTVQDSERALEVCAELGISAQFTLMVFHPHATLETVRSDIAFLRRHSGNPLNFCRAELYAGTPLEQRMIQEGRARGDYRARIYSLSDPGADVACTLAMETFVARCWDTGSLIERTIGTDHVSAVLGHFYEGPEVESLRQRVATWVRAANEDTIGLLDELVGACAASGDTSDDGFCRAIAGIQERERASLIGLRAEGLALRAEMDEFSLRMIGLRREAARPRLVPLGRAGMARHAAAVLLALGMAGAYGCHFGAGVCEVAPRPLKEEDKAPEKPAVQPLTNLPPRMDIGVCEYAPMPLEVKETKEDAAWRTKKKPFRYVVGKGNDGGTLSGISRLMYGDPAKWKKIYDANQGKIKDPNIIRKGMSILIPDVKEK
jgi:anaerobic magnesium-protoporphyrin IX monomethyl ester cyclase